MDSNPRVRQEDLFTNRLALKSNVYIYFFYRGQFPGAKHFSTEQPSLWVCAFVRGSARTIVQSPNVHSPVQKKKARKFTGRWHEKMGRKGLNCDAANATLHEQASWKRTPFLPFCNPFPILACTGSTTVLHLCRLPFPSLTFYPFFAFSFFPRRRN